MEIVVFQEAGVLQGAQVIKMTNLPAAGPDVVWSRKSRFWKRGFCASVPATSIPRLNVARLRHGRRKC